jgi:hypothetical protein
MKSISTPLLLKAAASTTLVVGLMFSSACSKTRDANSGSTASTTTSTDASTANATAASSTPATTTSTANDAAAVRASASDTWDSLKNYSYDQRSEFTQKVTEYANRLDNNLSVAKGSAGAKVTEARDELRTAAAELSNATADTWDATKDRVGRAMQKADSAIRSAAE